jgi:drug/metabolite transporter (DMT)-like permease
VNEKSSQRASADNPGAAILTIVGGISLLTMGDVFAKQIIANLSPFQHVMLRSLFAFIPVLIALQITNSWQFLRTKRPWGQAARGLSMAAAYGFYLQALRELPIADATAIIFSSPFFVALFSRLFLGEKVPPMRWFAIILGFVGALVIVQPGTEAFRPAALWGVAGALAAAITGLLARHLGSTEPASVTSFYTTIAFLLTGLLPVAVLPGLWKDPTGIEMAMIAGAGLIAGTAHFLIILAYRKAEASLVAPFEYSSLLVAIIMGFAVFGDLPTLPVWIGMGLIACAGALLARRA